MRGNIFNQVENFGKSYTHVFVGLRTCRKDATGVTQY